MSSPGSPTEPRRIAMWSGPRNLSTALMRAFEARGDCAVTDEPLYAVYLQATGLEHPAREAVLASQSSDWSVVAAELTGAVPGGRPLWYQKHMAHHLLPHVGRDWLDGLTHAFLLREPASMLASLARVWPNPTLEDTGLPQQLELYRRLREAGRTPPVIDSDDLLEDPAGQLRVLCDALEIPATDAMLTWQAGPRASDGVWAPHWYASVERSTGFGPPREAADPGALPEHVLPLLEPARAIHAELHAERLIPSA